MTDFLIENRQRKILNEPFLLTMGIYIINSKVFIYGKIYSVYNILSENIKIHHHNKFRLLFLAVFTHKIKSNKTKQNGRMPMS